MEANGQRAPRPRSTAPKRRHKFTPEDTAILQQDAQSHGLFPDRDRKEALATRLGTTVRCIQVWFQNQRQRKVSKFDILLVAQLLAVYAKCADARALVPCAEKMLLSKNHELREQLAEQALFEMALRHGGDPLEAMEAVFRACEAM